MIRLLASNMLEWGYVRIVSYVRITRGECDMRHNVQYVRIVLLTGVGVWV